MKIAYKKQKITMLDGSIKFLTVYQYPVDCGTYTEDREFIKLDGEYILLNGDYDNWTATNTAIEELAATIEQNNPLMDKLTMNERRIIDYIKTEALSNKEIADKLGVKERTIETHIRNINMKLGTKNRTEIAIMEV